MDPFPKGLFSISQSVVCLGCFFYSLFRKKKKKTGNNWLTSATLPFPSIPKIHSALKEIALVIQTEQWIVKYTVHQNISLTL